MTRRFHGARNDERPALRAGVLQGTGDLGLLTREMTQQLGFSPRWVGGSKWKSKSCEGGGGGGGTCGERFDQNVWR